MSAYSELQDLIYDLRENDIKTRLQLLKNPRIHRKYFLFMQFLNIDGRKSPRQAVNIFRRFKETALVFKSESLDFNLAKTGFFNDKDKYHSSQKMEARITDALLFSETKLFSMNSEYRPIYIRWGVFGTRKVVNIEVDSFDFVQYLTENDYVNINGTAYNKNGLDFQADYFNQSNSFSEMTGEFLQDTLDINIYTY